MLRSMSWEQLLEWHDYYQLEPWGEERADLRSGIVASVIANVNRDSKRQPRPYDAQDFMPDYTGERKHGREPITTQAQWEQFKQDLV